MSAVAATAGCAVEPIRRDIYGMDLQVVRPGVTPQQEEIPVLLQLKNTTTLRPDRTKTYFPYQLKKRQYLEQLAMPRSRVKALLVVMATSPVQADWSKGTHDALTVQYCCYWCSLEGHDVSPNVQAPTVHIPTTNVFDAPALTDILDRLDRGEALT